MIHSRWRPDRGGYDLFEVSGTVDLGNDMPTPSLRPTSPIGVSSITIGRSPRGFSRPLGSSPVPVGTVMPTRSALLNLSGFGLPSDQPWLTFAIGGLVGWGVSLLLARWSRT